MTSKTQLRQELRARRAALAQALPDHPGLLAAQAAALAIAPMSLVGAYQALPGEADPRLLLLELAAEGCNLAFPRVAAKGQALVFHRWGPDRPLIRGAFGVLEPEPDWPVAAPRIVLVPLLGFDASGHRLGYGGGYYDRTLAALRAAGPLRAIGVAYAGQEVERLPHEPHDHPLDALVTEQGVRTFPRP
jgi:5-formyltetrahydrofolate cyclo-ligase